MADVKKDGKGAAEATKEVNTRKAHKGTAKRRAAQRVGAKGAWMPTEQPTAAKSAQAWIANGRRTLLVAGGRAQAAHLAGDQRRGLQAHPRLLREAGTPVRRARPPDRKSVV